MPSPTPASIFISYASADERYRHHLETHLAPLQREGLVQTWTFRQIDAGDDWRAAINARLNTAEIILLLVSASFIASDYCWSVELKRAIERHEAGEAIVIPVIVRPCDWQNTPFARFQAVPRGGRPISKWSPRDDAWLNVVRAIRQSVAAGTATPPANVKVGESPQMAPPQIVAQQHSSPLPLLHLESACFGSPNSELDFAVRNFGVFVTILEIEVVTPGCKIRTWWPNTLPPSELLRIPTTLQNPDAPECVYHLRFLDSAGVQRICKLTLDRRRSPPRLYSVEIPLAAAQHQRAPVRSSPSQKISPYHTESHEYPPDLRNFYHDHADCKYSKNIQVQHRVIGTGGKPRCSQCSTLEQ